MSSPTSPARRTTAWRCIAIPRTGEWGGFIAWDPVHGRKLWEIPEKFMVMSGTLATAGDVVFYGTVDGWFRAVDAWTGKVLWSQKLSSGSDRTADHLHRP